jgi:alkylation response protein AidB-like acyl-CoA dehydrogenase
MDFRLGPEADEVRDLIRDFLQREFSEADRLRVQRDGSGHDWELYRKLAAEGWVSAGWPKELGGGGRSPLEILALYWELCKAGFPWFGLLNNGFIGHTLLALGTEHHKHEFVPRIAGGEILVALGYSEPGSGSDVAAARTTATREGDDWIIDGQKMWTTTGHVADYIFTLTRTRQEERPHRGLTIFLIDTRAEGVEIQPVRTMGGERSNAVYLSGVRVPDSTRVGEVDQGWRVVRFALGLEQAMGFADLQEAFLETAGAWALQTNDSGERPFDDPRVREQLGQTAIHAEVARLDDEVVLRAHVPPGRPGLDGARRSAGDARARGAPRRRRWSVRGGLSPDTRQHDLRGHGRDPAQPHRRGRAGPSEEPLTLPIPR